MNTYALILAAGKSHRLNTVKSKLLQPLLDKCVVEYVVNSLKNCNVDDIYAVVGYQKEEVKTLLGEKVKYIEQVNQLGTANAVNSSYEQFKDKEGIIIITCGDMPLIDESIFNKIIMTHKEEKNDATILVGKSQNPKGMGRVIIENGRVRIVEEKEATSLEKKINNINSGTYCFNIDVLFPYLNKIKNENIKKEYYLTDIFNFIQDDNKKVGVIVEEDESYLYGVNDFVELARASQVLRKKINQSHCLKGVNIADIENTYIGMEVIIEPGVNILPNTTIFGKSKIEEGAQIGPNSILNNTLVGKNAKINSSQINDSIIEENCQVGPFSNIKQASIIKKNAIIGDFVEVKKSVVGEYSKAKHHAYIGDAVILSRVNVGCGVIFANYDGVKKNPTLVKENVFIGSNVTLVAPLVVSENSYIAAGSTITEDIPPFTLAIARQKQINKLEYKRRI